MMGAMEVNEVLLPGVGVRYEFTTRDRQGLAVVALRGGGFTLAAYEPGDPDAPTAQYRLTEEEAETVAQILGAPRMIERFADLSREVPGLSAGQITLEPASPYVGQTLGATRSRTRTGASVVALVREDDVVASPTPQQSLAAGDVLVVIGTPEGIDAVRTLLRDG